MAAGNTQFKVENGLRVIGDSNVYGSMRIENDLTVGGNLAFFTLAAADIVPGISGVSMGNSSLRWIMYGANANFSGNVTVTDTLIVNNTIAANLVPSTNNSALGSSTLRWDFYANNANLLTAGISGNLTVGVVFANTSTLALTGSSNSTLSVNTGSKLAIWATGNTSYSNLVLTNDVTNIYGNVVFDTDTFFIDAVNNRVGFKNTSPSTAAMATVTGNVEFSTSNTGIRLNTSNATINASIMMVSTGSNSRVTFATYDNSNSTTQDGGFNFNGTNSTATQSLLSFNGYNLLYKSGNVAHSGNFGIYNVSGTRVGP